MCWLWTYVVCSWRNWVHWQILSLTLSKWRWPVWCCSCWRWRSIERNPALLLAQRGWGCCCWGWGDAWENCLYTKGILCAKVWTRLNHLGAKIEKSPTPPPTPSPRSVATLPRKVAIFLGIFYLKCWEVCISDAKDKHPTFSFRVIRSRMLPPFISDRKSKHPTFISA